MARKPKQKHPSVVYFIQAGQHGPIKIGFTTRLEERLHDLQGGNPIQLRLLATIRGNASHEQLLHTQFQEHRVRGEWFRPTAQLLRLIQTIKRMEDEQHDIKAPGLSGHVSSIVTFPMKRHKSSRGSSRRSGQSAEEAVIEHIDLARARRSAY